MSGTQRAAFTRAFAATARRRLRRAQDLLAIASPDASRYLQRELHLLGGEAAFLGFGEIFTLVRRGEEQAKQWPDDAAVSDQIDMTLASIACLLPPLPEPLPAAPRRALIVADSVAQGWLLRDLLEHAGYETAVVTDAAARADLVPDVVLCSLTSTARLDTAVRVVRGRSPAPLLLVSAETREELAGEAARVHADGFVSTAGGLLAAMAEIRTFEQEAT
jgi:CheY-like chemotaxis protein